ncbi:MAG: hypothetical protein KH452_04765 [Clostridiales bacterium]|nr:hypothetical protein [Clostridiales bacterium]
MDTSQMKICWQGEVISVQPRSTVWRYITDNRTHRECGFNIFLKGRVTDLDGNVVTLKSTSGQYDFCIAISEKQEEKLQIRIGDVLKGSAWTKKYPEIEFADYYRAGALKKVTSSGEENIPLPNVIIDRDHTRYDGMPIPRVNSGEYPGPPWKMTVPPLEVYAWRGERMLSKSCWKGKCFQCIWANMANVTVQYDFDRNIVKNRFETFCYGPLSCKYYKMGPARAVPYKGMSSVKDEGWLDEICVEYRDNEDE